MKTSEITIRPWSPMATEEECGGRDPFTTLTFGNGTIEIDYTLFRSLKFDNASEFFCKSMCVGNRAIGEIEREMEAFIWGELDSSHRDYKSVSQSPFLSDKFRNDLHPDHEEIEQGELKELTAPEGTCTQESVKLALERGKTCL